MKKVLLPVLLAGIMACSNSQQAEKKPANPLEFASVIDSAYMAKHLTYIASDELKGRDTGSEGQQMAADYIIKEYKRLGVTPGMPDSSYLQPVEFKSSQLNSVTYTIKEILPPPPAVKKGQKAPEMKEPMTYTTVLSATTEFDINPTRPGTASFNGGVVFAGIGVSDSARGVMPFEGVDITGKWVLGFVDFPKPMDGDTVLNPAINNQTRFLEIIMERGAKGMLLISPSDAHYNRFMGMTKSSIGKPGRLELAYLAKDDDEGPEYSYNYVRPSVGQMLLGLKDSTELANKYNEIVSNLKEFKAMPLAFEIDVKVDMEPVKASSANIVGVIEGSDPMLKNEYVVISAHYDHVGVGSPDKSGDTIYNGADDDGSGTVGILSVAEALSNAKKAGVGPKRSVIILHVTGEEKGLLGSRFYSDHTSVPVKDIIANINVDMIGRLDNDYVKTNDGNYVYIIGGSIISSAMDSLLQKANNETTKIKLDMKYNDLNDPNQFYRRSDHWNFGRLGIPFSFFFNGVHPDYHRPSDEVDKIDFNSMAKRSQLVYAYTLELANMNGRPLVDNQEFINKTKAIPR